MFDFTQPTDRALFLDPATGQPGDRDSEGGQPDRRPLAPLLEIDVTKIFTSAAVPAVILGTRD
jgi:hypothetical protein